MGLSEFLLLYQGLIVYIVPMSMTSLYLIYVLMPTYIISSKIEYIL